MTTILPPTKARALEVHHKGQKDGANVKLRGVAPPNEDAPQAPKQNGYIIKPSGAKGGENISINGGGLIIRARNDKNQTITAKSTPDNQLQVQVGQGKSAVQLSIQVTPQGKRGEVELECVRNKEENGETTGYTVSVKRPEEESRTCKQNQHANSPGRRRSPPESCAYSPRRSNSPPESRESSPDRGRHYHELPSESSPDKSTNTPERCRSNFAAAASQGLSYFPYGAEARAIKDDATCAYPNERQQSRQAPTRRNEQAHAPTASPMKAPNQPRKPDKEIPAEEYDADLHYRRKLDTHHHKPTISYLIGRRMTELFKEMRKTAALHHPPPFIKF